MSLHATTWQTVGPFFSIGMKSRYLADLAGPQAEGQRIVVQGRVLDGDEAPISDAILEIWQANAHGKYAHPDDRQDKPVDPGFLGYGRVPTDAEGRFAFSTIKPGAVGLSGESVQAPHLLVGLMMRGLLRRLVTRMYFPGEPLNEQDEILRRVPTARRATLLMTRDTQKPDVFRWDIHMQGAAETVFFDF
jgi:protocatechuate 3,4-dioxygenase, alpha subunit